MHALQDITLVPEVRYVLHAYRGHSLARPRLQNALYAKEPHIQTNWVPTNVQIAQQAINILIHQFVLHASLGNSKRPRNKINVINVPLVNILPMKEEDLRVLIVHGDGTKDLREGLFVKPVPVEEFVALIQKDQHVIPGNIQKLDDGGHASRAVQKNKHCPIKKDVNGAPPENLLSDIRELLVGIAHRLDGPDQAVGQ